MSGSREDYDSRVWDDASHPGFFYQDMLSDSDRMRRYREAIEEVVCPGDVVADLGTGLGVLALMAVRAGAALVYAIDLKPASLWLARKIVEANGAADRVRLIEGDIREVELEQPVDVIVNELIGNFGTDEGIYESVRTFAARNLAPEGRIVPERLRTWLVPVEYGRDFRGAFRKDNEGLDLSPALAIPYRSQPTLHTLRDMPKQLASPACVENVTFSGAMPERPRVEIDLDFEVQASGVLQGFVGYFDSTLVSGNDISMWPPDSTCHWQHWHWPLQPPVPVSEADRLTATLRIRIEPSGARGWDLQWRRSPR
jgi:protein arginine N-methyltransferase 1